MKKSIFIESFKMLFVMLVCSLLGTDVSLAEGPGSPLGGSPTGQSAEGVPGVAGAGVHVPGGSFSVEEARREAGDDILVSAIDKVVTKIYPYKTPLDQIFRYTTQRPAKSMKVEWTSIDTKPFTTEVSTGGGHTVTPVTPTVNHDVNVALTVDDASVFAKNSTILVPGIMGFNADGSASTTVQLQLYVKAKAGNVLTVMAVNGGLIGGSSFKYVPTIAAATELLRMGRAHYEKDIQTEPSSAYPTKANNYMQSFKCQVEQSFWYRDSLKEIDWTIEDQKEMAIMEWKMEMEATYLNGVQGVVYDDSDKKGEIYFCNGILRYITKEYEYALAGWTLPDFTGLTKAVFTGNSGSQKRIFLMGSDLMESIMNVDLTAQKSIDRKSELYFGIKFRSIETNFGTLLCLHHELLDLNGMANQGIVIDPNHLFKYVFESENSRKIDNREAGISNTEADVTTEVSCPGLKYPQAHLKVVQAAA